MRTQFANGIRHPDLYLWDAWSYQCDDLLHLFCLAIPRRDAEEKPIDPKNRNLFEFHIHHFESGDLGVTWCDAGVHRRPGMALPHDDANIWSGSITPIGSKLVEAYTGIRRVTEDRPFLQSLLLSVLDADADAFATQAHCLLCPERDYGEIRASGYYLDALDNLGSNRGECDGAILAWRDPFLFTVEESVYMAFAAKSNAKQAVMGMARLTEDLSQAVLLPPISLPDASEFTQFEVPKVVYIGSLDKFILLAATTDRQSETQDEKEVAHHIRLYTAKSPLGPWVPCGRKSSVIHGVADLFGATCLGFDEPNGRIMFIAPYTSNAPQELELTFAPRFFVDIDQLGQEDKVFATWS